ncbi:MAG TPA: beta-galactosidase, partial [Candidatus Baltobacteraceae bacterium]|nr:beta-galactosidase [Candidatus Baltobacteraceae bacterium]
MYLLLAALLWSTWHTSSVSTTAGIPVFTVESRPYFVYGAAFFYERTPRSEWRSDLLAYKRLGINTIDLYLIWNWHEPDAHTIDFTGATNQRRNLHALFSIIHELGLKAIVRPGPVIRNEWRNGGYPDWLLERPGYAMPLHDILEGRYPATATLQNAHADAAAAEWMRNSTHMAQSARWLRDVLGDIEPWSHDVIAIALDDDQGAYIDNDTWPAPHWHRYIQWLRTTVASIVGPRVPLFINSYQMKVTASAPVWAWGNWYQSDVQAIGDHDIAQLAFSTALLQTQPGKPVMASEFQAGWLQGADEVSPRSSIPGNTTIALHEMLQLGVHGVVNFPLADTVNPAGWEAPWTNRFYAWGAAFTLQGRETARGAAVNAFAQLLARHGSAIAQMRPVADVAIAWLPSAYDPALVPNDRIGRIAQLTIAEEQRCRTLARTCRFIDLAYDTMPDLLRTRYVVIPQTGFPMRFEPAVEARLSAMRAHGIHIVSSLDAAVASGAPSTTHNVTDAALLLDAAGVHGLFDTINPSPRVRTVAETRLRVGGRTVRIRPFAIEPYGAHDVWIDGSSAHAVVDAPQMPISARATSYVPPWHAVGAHSAIVYPLDVYRDGEGSFVLDNGAVRAVVVPNAGARAFVLEAPGSNRNAFTSIGALRDDVASPASPSPRDYIAAYTHPIEA